MGTNLINPGVQSGSLIGEGTGWFAHSDTVIRPGFEPKSHDVYFGHF